MLLKADYSDDPQQTKKEQDEADRWKATETSKAITSFKEDIKMTILLLKGKQKIYSHVPKQIPLIKKS